MRTNLYILIISLIVCGCAEKGEKYMTISEAAARKSISTENLYDALAVAEDIPDKRVMTYKPHEIITERLVTEEQLKSLLELQSHPKVLAERVRRLEKRIDVSFASARDMEKRVAELQLAVDKLQAVGSKDGKNKSKRKVEK